MKRNRARKLENPSIKTIIIVFGMILIVLTSFFGGYFTYRGLMGEGHKAADDVVSIIDKVGFVYDPEKDDYVPLEKDKIAQLIAGSFLDGYSKYYTEEEYKKLQKQNDGEYSGFGFLVFIADKESTKDGSNAIAGVQIGSPAYEQGVLAGDQIVSATVVKENEQEQETVSIQNGKELSDFLSTVTLNQTVEFEIKRNGELLPNPVEITASEYMLCYLTYFDSENSAYFKYSKQDRVGNAETVIQHMVKNELAQTQQDYQLEENDAYIRLDSFGGDAVIQFEAILNYMQEQGKTDLILDLCGNGGGSMEVFKQIASYLIYNGGKNGYTVAYTTEKLSSEGEMIDGKHKVENVQIAMNNFNNGIQKITVLADENTASASECLIGALEYYGVNETEPYKAQENLIICQSVTVNEEDEQVIKYATFGKGIMQTTYPLQSGGALKLTTAKLLWPDRTTCIHKTGITTDVEENRVLDQNGAILRALEIIKDDVIN